MVEYLDGLTLIWKFRSGESPEKWLYFQDQDDQLWLYIRTQIIGDDPKHVKSMDCIPSGNHPANKGEEQSQPRPMEVVADRQQQVSQL